MPPAQNMTFQVKTDGEYHIDEVDLSASPEYRSVISGIRLDPAEEGGRANG
jgi:hypothetical protein